MLQFSDGISIDTRGHLRIIELSDGLYITGEGLLVPIDTIEEGKELIKKFEEKKKFKK